MKKQVDSEYLPKELQPLWEEFLKADGLEEEMKIGRKMYNKMKTLPKATQQRLMEAFAQQPPGVMIEPLDEE